MRNHVLAALCHGEANAMRKEQDENSSITNPEYWKQFYELKVLWMKQIGHYSRVKHADIF